MSCVYHYHSKKKDEVIEKLCRNKYQRRLETSMRCSGFIFECVYLLHYICYKINRDHI